MVPSDAVGAVALDAEPAAAEGAAAGLDRAQLGHALLGQPADRAAGGLGGGRHHRGRGAHVGELDRGDRARAGIGGVVAGGDPVDAVLLGLEPAAGDAVGAGFEAQGAFGAGGGGDLGIQRPRS